MPDNIFAYSINRTILRACIMGILCLFIYIQNQAQKKTLKDTLTADSIAIMQFQIKQDDNQRKIDSLVALKLEQELKGMGADNAKAGRLEEELKRIRGADSIRKQNQQNRIALLRSKTEGYPVAPFGDTLFMLYLKLGVTMPEQRATNISRKIVRLYEDYFFNPDSLKLEESESGYELIYKGTETILVVTEADALWFNESPKALAQTYTSKIISAIKKHKADNSLSNWTKRILAVLVMFLGVLLLVAGIEKIFSLMHQWLLKRRHESFKGVHVGKFRLLSSASQAQLFFKFLKGLKWLIIGLAIYLSLPILFSILPGTEYIANILLNWIASPAKKFFRSIIDFLPNVFTIGIVYFFTSTLVRILRYFMSQIESGELRLTGFHSDFARPTFNILRFVLNVFMLIIIFPYLPGSGSPAFQGISVFVGVLLSLGSSSAINNVLAGLVITYMRPFKIGDRIRIGEITGDVLEKSLLVIKLRTIKNEEITIPNSTILSSNTLNYSAFSNDSGLVLHTTVTIGYDAPWRKVHALLINAALSTDGINKTPAPFVWQTSLNDFHISYQLNVYTNLPGKQGDIYAALHASIQDAFRDAGIEILSPAYTSFRNGNNSTIPPAELNKNDE